MSVSSSSNPYAVSTEALVGPDYGNDVETIRKKYLSHEASVKSIGTLYMLGAVLIGLVAVSYFIGGIVMLSQQPAQAAGAVALIGAAVFMGAISGLYVFAARGLWQLRPWARIVATVLSAIGLLGFPLGTIISAYFLYLLQSQKGATVFSEDYKRVIAATPHVKYKTSLIAWVLLGLLVALVIVVIIAAVGSR